MEHQNSPFSSFSFTYNFPPNTPCPSFLSQCLPPSDEHGYIATDADVDYLSSTANFATPPADPQHHCQPIVYSGDVIDSTQNFATAPDLGYYGYSNIPPLPLQPYADQSYDEATTAYHTITPNSYQEGVRTTDPVFFTDPFQSARHRNVSSISSASANLYNVSESVGCSRDTSTFTSPEIPTLRPSGSLPSTNVLGKRRAMDDRPHLRAELEQFDSVEDWIKAWLAFEGRPLGAKAPKRRKKAVAESDGGSKTGARRGAKGRSPVERKKHIRHAGICPFCCQG